MLVDVILNKKYARSVISKIHKNHSETVARSIVKAVSWRILGTLDTVIIAYFVTGTIAQALSIGFIEWASKMILYFLHERAWNSFHWGKTLGKEKVGRSVVKAIGWRILGTLDTILIAYFVTGTITQALSIGFIEWASKMVLYFVHERSWNMFHWGKKCD